MLKYNCWPEILVVKKLLVLPEGCFDGVCARVSAAVRHRLLPTGWYRPVTLPNECRPTQGYLTRHCPPQRLRSYTPTWQREMYTRKNMQSINAIITGRTNDLLVVIQWRNDSTSAGWREARNPPLEPREHCVKIGTRVQDTSIKFGLPQHEHIFYYNFYLCLVCIDRRQ